MNNSGTTLLGRVLESHPEVRSLPQEGQHLTDAFPRPDLLGVGRLWTQRLDLFRWTAESDPAPAAKARKDWANHYAKPPGILLEKSPPNTVRSLWLQKNFQPSRFLAIVRHPYAVCEGIRRRKDYPIEAAARHWRDANTLLLEDSKKLDHYLMVKYDDLVTNPASELNRIQKFLDLAAPFDLSTLAEVTSHSMEGTTAGLTNLDTQSFKRLSRDDKNTIDKLCGSLMAHYGFTRN